MKKRKTRKEKMRSQQRTRNELQTLKLHESDLKGKIIRIKKTNKKNIVIRNLKFFWTVSNYLLPYVLASTLTTGTFYLFGGGYPFIKDSIGKYKYYSIESDYEGEILYKESYEENKVFDAKPTDANIKVYFPWDQLSDGTYQRKVRDYDIVGTKELIEAVLYEDYSYINEVLTDYIEEIETRNVVDDLDQSHIVCSIVDIDFTDSIYIPESDEKNLRITILEILISLLLGLLVNSGREFVLSKKFKDIKSKYPIEDTYELEKKLDEVHKKILSYRNGGVR